MKATLPLTKQFHFLRTPASLVFLFSAWPFTSATFSKFPGNSCRPTRRLAYFLTFRYQIVDGQLATKAQPKAMFQQRARARCSYVARCWLGLDLRHSAVLSGVCHGVCCSCLLYLAWYLVGLCGVGGMAGGVWRLTAVCGMRYIIVFLGFWVSICFSVFSFRFSPFRFP